MIKINIIFLKKQEENVYIFIASIIGYLFGCIHGSQLVGNYKNINIKRTGIKNAGAANTTIVLGWKYGIIVAFIDIFKTILSIALILLLLNKAEIINDAQIIFIYINALFVILGHNYPLPMNFKGGKGTASLFGLLLVIDWKIAIVGIGIILLFALVTDYLVIGVLFMYLSFIAYTYFLFGIMPFTVSLSLFILSLIKHKENFRRIANKEEIRLSSLLQKETS